MAISTFEGLPLEVIYKQAYLSQFGVSFEAFARDPAGWLAMLGQGDAPEIIRAGYRPLLPVQVRLRQEWMEQWRKDGSWGVPGLVRQLPAKGSRG